jgi:two-component system, LytTR family, response regulator
MLFDDRPPAAATVAFPGLWAPSRDGRVRIDTGSIVWIEAAGDYALIHTPSRSHMLRTTLEGLLQQLPPDEFARVSRSAIVRTNAVTAAIRRPRGGLALKVGDDETLAVGQSYVAAVKRLLPAAPRRRGVPTERPVEI